MIKDTVVWNKIHYAHILIEIPNGVSQNSQYTFHTFDKEEPKFYNS